VKYAAIGPIAIHYPQRAETNEELQQLFPHWDMDIIYQKTGIATRYIAAEDECSSDLGVAAAEKLFETHNIDPASIDFVLFCTQTPDYPLPTTACLMQTRLGIPTSAGALDFNLGCSGFVYGLALADGLIRLGPVRRVLVDHGRNVLEIHRSDGSQSADDFWGCRSGNSDRSGRPADSFRFSVRHGWPRRRHVDRRRGRSETSGGRHQAASPQAMAQ
jgi:hypothetical protein